MSLLYQVCKRRALVIFTVSQYHARLARSDHIEPAHQIGLARVRAESAQCVNGRLHRDCFSENLHLFLTIDKPSAQRALTLITNDEHMRAGFPKVGSQMMKNAAAVAHSGAG